MRERDRWGSEWVRERGRLLKRERERKRYIDSRDIIYVESLFWDNIKDN